MTSGNVFTTIAPAPTAVAERSRLPQVLGALGAIVFFSNLPDFLEVREFVPQGRSIWVALFLVMCVPVFRVVRATRALSTPLCRWAAAFLLVSILWFGLSAQTDVAFLELKTRAVSMILLVALTYAFSFAQGLRAARRALCVVVVAGAILNVVEFFVVIPLLSVFAGRSAGLYLNPNRAGIALVLGMVLSVGVIPPRWRPAYLLTTAIGVAATLSRSALLCLLMAIVCLALWRRVNGARLLLYAGAMCVIAAAAVITLDYGDYVTRVIDVTSNSDEVERAFSVFNRGQLEDASAMERQQVAGVAWEMFLSSPILGHGTASTTDWDEPVQPHNIYLKFLAEHGVVGFFLFPALLACFLWKLSPEFRPETYGMTAVLFINGFFSHNMVDEYPVLVCLALLGCMTVMARSGTLPADAEPV